MKVKLDDEIIFEITDLMLKSLEHDLVDPIEEIKRRLHWVIQHKCDQCYDRLKGEWLEKIIEEKRVESIPADKEKLLDLIISQPDYRNRIQRENV